jgi:hypothetical protein
MRCADRRVAHEQSRHDVSHRKVAARIMADECAWFAEAHGAIYCGALTQLAVRVDQDDWRAVWCGGAEDG